MRAVIQDPRGKFRPNWLGSYIVKTILSRETAKPMDINREGYTRYTNLDQLKYYA